jgi:hypothetical protein
MMVVEGIPEEPVPVTVAIIGKYTRADREAEAQEVRASHEEQADRQEVGLIGQDRDPRQRSLLAVRWPRS